MALSKMEDTKEPDFSKWLCRCSAISKIMTNSKDSPPLTALQELELAELDVKINRTEKQGIKLAELIAKREKAKDVVLSDTAIGYLVEAYAYETEGMCSITKEMDVEYFDRGKKTEPESIELLSFVDDHSYVKNEERLYNNFLSGVMDVYRGESHHKPTAIGDIKSCKDYPTFLYKIHKGLDAGNKEQVQGYGDLGLCDDLFVAFTLPNMPEDQRNGYSYKLAMKMGVATSEDPEFKIAWTQLERSMIFDRIDKLKRVYKIPITPFTKYEQQAVYDRVKVCREWLIWFHEFFNKLNR